MSIRLPAQTLGAAQTAAIAEALKPYLRAAGVRTVEKRIGKPKRYFANVRQRGTMSVRDFLATCAVLGLDPAEFLHEALREDRAPNIRPPRIIASAHGRLLGEDDHGPIPQEQLDRFADMAKSAPRRARGEISRSMTRATRHQVPELLGWYGTALRSESNLLKAQVVLEEALRISETLNLEIMKVDLLIRLAYVSLETGYTVRALSLAQEATLIATRLADAEGQGRGFQTTGMFRYYLEDYKAALQDAYAAADYLSRPLERLSAYQLAALCCTALGDKENARLAAESAKALSTDAPEWIQGKLAWLDARLSHGTIRLRHLQAARSALCPTLPADCVLVTVELVEEALSLGKRTLAEEETVRLCALLEHRPSPRVEQAVLRLVRHRTGLTPELVTRIRNTLDRVRSRELATIVSADY
jgi:tetratricopeptide (TPR) repeat protein